MVSGGNANLASVSRSSSHSLFCPECGQPLTLARAEPDQRRVVFWHSIFVIAVGLFLSITFGLGALHAETSTRTATACPESVVEIGCVSAPPGRTTRLSTQYLTGGDVLAPRLADRDLRSDLRYLVVGLIGLGVGLGAVLVHRKRPRLYGFGVSVLLAVEGLSAVFYGEILLLGVYLLVVDTPTGTPFTVGILGDSLFRALTMVFALVGVS